MAVIGSLVTQFVGEHAGFDRATVEIRQRGKSVAEDLKKNSKEVSAELASQEKAAAESLRRTQAAWEARNRAIAESVRTPQEKADTALKDLDARFAAGGINADVYKRAVSAVRNDVSKSLGQAGVEGGEKFLGGLKSVLGEQSKLGEIFKVVKGAGAVAAVSLGLGIVANFARQSREAVDAYRDGSISAEDMRLKLAESVPVLGQLVQGAHDLALIFEGGVTKAVERAAANLDLVSEKIRALGASRLGWGEDLEKSLLAAKRTIEGMNLTPLDRQLFDIRNGLEDSLQSISKKYEGQLRAPEVVAAVAERAKLRTSRDAIQKDLDIYINELKRFKSMSAEEEKQWREWEGGKRGLTGINEQIATLDAQITKSTAPIEGARTREQDAARAAAAAKTDEALRDAGAAEIQKAKEVQDAKDKLISDAAKRQAEDRKAFRQAEMTAQQKYLDDQLALEARLKAGKVTDAEWAAEQIKLRARLEDDLAAEQRAKEKSMQSQADSWRGRIQTPEESLQAQLAQIRELALGSQLTQDEALRAMSAAAESSGGRSGATRGPDAVERRAAQFVPRGAESSAAAEQLRVAKLSLAAELGTKTVLGNIEKALSSGPKLVLVK